MFLKDILKNFTEFTGKHLRQSLLFNKVVGRARNFIKRKTLAQVFSCEFCQIFKNTFFTEKTSGRQLLNYTRSSTIEIVRSQLLVHNPL